MNKIIKSESAVQFSTELVNNEEKSRRTRWMKFSLAALSGIPWVGSFIGASVSLSSEVGQSDTNVLFRAWLDTHSAKIAALQSAMERIAKEAEKAPHTDTRLEDGTYLDLVQQGFRVWDKATTSEGRERVRRTLTNAAVSGIASDDLVRLFLTWIDTYDEIHFRIVGLLHAQTLQTRHEIWEQLDGRPVAENSGDADLFKMFIRDLSTGGVIRQQRATNSAGAFMKKPRAKPTGQTHVMKSAFDDIEQYELTELGHQFVGYAMDEPTDALKTEDHLN